jgi:hypothetical protein
MRNTTFTASYLTAVAFGIGLGATAPALAMDPLCQTLLSQKNILMNKPFHIYMTSEKKFSSANFAKAANSLGVTGAKTSEEIWTGKDVYVQTDGKWIDMQTSYAQMTKDAADAADDPDIKKMRDAEKCSQLPDEVAFGQPAAVYQSSNSELGTIQKIWTSKSTHLPLKSEIHTDVGPMKEVTFSRYEYTNTQAPAGAISMKQMMQQHKH